MTFVPRFAFAVTLLQRGSPSLAQASGSLRGHQVRIASPEGIRNKALDLPYADQWPAQKLDLYRPGEGSSPFRVIVAIPSGVFKSKDKSDGQVNPTPNGPEPGYAVVSINERPSGVTFFTAQIRYVKAAIRWLRANAQVYKLDSDQIAAWGRPAGGHLASLAKVFSFRHQYRQ